MDLFAAEALADPYAAYRELRETDPVHWSTEHDAWILTRYEDVASGLRDPRLSAGRIQEIFARLPESLAAELPALREVMERWLVFLDPPEHTRLRDLVSYAFKPSSIERLRPTVQALADELARGLPSGPFDLISQFAYPLPARVIARMLGVGDHDLPRLRSWSDSFARLEDGPDALRFAEKCTVEMRDYLLPAIEERRRVPTDDILGALVRAEEQGQILSTTEIVATCVLLLFAGHETTTNLIGNGVRLLLGDRATLDRLSRGDLAVESFVEEVLRFDPPVHRVRRVVAVAHELAGKQLRVGDQVWLSVAAGNRDPEAFRRPEEFLPDRLPGKRILTFGQGPHYCLGAHLGRIEGEIGLRALLPALARLRCAAAFDQLKWRRDLSFRGLESLEVVQVEQA